MSETGNNTSSEGEETVSYSEEEVMEQGNEEEKETIEAILKES